MKIIQQDFFSKLNCSLYSKEIEVYYKKTITNY
ncbi:putative transposon-encoded protein [Chitinophagaceae bacterium OAS944]|nr:putative transposon-encoded protein [Chitinophagaceae bacterium OAS944]